MGKGALNPTMTVLYEAKVTLDFSQSAATARRDQLNISMIL